MQYINSHYHSIMTKVTFSKQVRTGKFNEVEMAKYYAKQVKSMERQNAKILANPTKYKGYSVCCPIKFADMQLRLNKHNFEICETVLISENFVD